MTEQDIEKEEDREDPDMYLVSAYVANGGRLMPDRAYCDSEGRVVFVVRGRSEMFSKVEEDWYSPDSLLKRYKGSLQEVKALMHRVKGYGNPRSNLRAD